MIHNTESVIEHFNTSSGYAYSNVITDIRKSIIQLIIKNAQNKQILDIGCGNGDVTINYVNDNYVTFVDFSDTMIEKVKDKLGHVLKSNAKVIKSDIESLNLSTKFDFIVCMGVIAHVNNVNLVIQKLSNMLNKDGQIILQYTDSKKLISSMLNLKNQLKSTLKNKSTYKINKTTSNDIYTFLKNENLKITNKINYYPILPLMSLLSSKSRKLLLEKLNNNYLLRKFGSEIVLVLEKDTEFNF